MMLSSNDPRWISTEALNDILNDVIDNPSKWIKNADFIYTLKSQGRLAKWENTERKIISCSLNTLKSSADDVLDDGYAGLDLKRINAISAIEDEVAKEHKPKRGTRVDLEARVKEQASHISALEAHNMTLTYYIRELQVLANVAIKSDGSRASIIRYQRELEVIHTKLAFSGESDLVTQPETVDE